MNALNRLSIRTRLYFGTVFSLVLLVVIGAMVVVAVVVGMVGAGWY